MLVLTSYALTETFAELTNLSLTELKDFFFNVSPARLGDKLKLWQ